MRPYHGSCTEQEQHSILYVLFIGRILVRREAKQLTTAVRDPHAPHLPGVARTRTCTRGTWCTPA